MLNTENINSGINLISLGKEFGLNVNSEDKVLCLHHSEKTPSMQLYHDHAYCFSCNKRLDAIGMTQEVKGLNFKEAAEYLVQKQGISIYEKPNKKSIHENSCLKNSLWQKRMNILTEFYDYISTRVNENDDYTQVFNWIQNRGFDFNFLIGKDFWNSNFLILNNSYLEEFKNKIGIEALKQIELIKSNGQFSWLGDNYNLAFPCWYPLLNKETNNTEWKVTSLKIRNTGALTEKSVKEVELVLPKSLKDQNIPSSLGFYGLKYWADIYPQVLNQCEGLTVYITEGPTDMIAGFHLLNKNENTIVLSAGSIQKVMHANNLKLIKNCRKIVVAFDNDVAGRNATVKLIEAARKNGIHNISTLKFLDPEIKDLNDILKKVDFKECQEKNEYFEVILHEPISKNKNSNGLNMSTISRENQLGSFDPIGYIRTYLDANNYKIHPSGYVIDDKNCSVKEFINELEVQAYYEGVKTMDSKMIEKSFHYMASELRKNEVLKLRSKMFDYVPDKNNNMARFIKALTGVEQTHEEYPFMLFCFEHFIRQVKLKICGLPVYQELMLIIVGAQNQGKTTAIRKFLSPLDYFYIERSLQDISNLEKNCLMFENNFVILCEEMQKAGMSVIEVFKYIITAIEISARRYHSQYHFQVKNNCTLIGTSNKPTSEGIYDPTGMRRFIDIEIKIPKCNFDELENIDYVSLWKGVKHILSKEEKEEFYKTYNKLIVPKQEEMRAKECVELFINEDAIEEGNVLCPTSKVFARYRQWCLLNGFNHPKNSSVFSKKMIQYLKLKKGLNLKDSSGNRVLPLNKVVQETSVYSGY